MELTSTQQNVICHFKDQELVSVTYFNGHPKQYSVKEMGRKEVEDFFEVNKADYKSTDV